jgi:hypothetical protein
MTPPDCAWCPDPAAEQVHMGTALRGSAWVPLYAWLCEPHATEAHREKEAGIRG